MAKLPGSGTEMFRVPLSALTSDENPRLFCPGIPSVLDEKSCMLLAARNPLVDRVIVRVETLITGTAVSGAIRKSAVWRTVLSAHAPSGKNPRNTTSSSGGFVHMGYVSRSLPNRASTTLEVCFKKVLRAIQRFGYQLMFDVVLSSNACQ
jgi:hypothetical protein